MPNKFKSNIYNVDIVIDTGNFVSLTDQRYIAPAWAAIRNEAITAGYTDENFIGLTLQRQFDTDTKVIVWTLSARYLQKERE